MAETTPTEGMSKKQLDKLAKKEKKKDSTNSDTNNNSSANDAKFTVLFNKTNPPLLTRVIDIISQSQCSIKYTINKIMPDNSLPILIDSDLLDGSIAGDVNIVKYFLRTVTTSSITSLYSSTNPWYLSQVDQWLDVYNLCQTNSGYATTTIPTLLNNHLSNRTYLVGDDLTIADLAMIFVLLQSNYVSTTDQPHFCRWMKLASLSFPADVLTTSIPLHFAPIPKLTEVSGAGKKETNKAGKVTTDSKAKTAEVVDEGGTCPPLEGAIEGQVCTRFPPEPSGYLHIGHAKAVLLNQYYAQRYKGKLLVRFDDTNPSKEKEEFQENIIQDLATLRVFPDKVSHSSDHFKTCEELAVKMIKEGKAYMDNTDQETMQAERMERKESKHRDSKVEDNLKLFEKLIRGDPDATTYCLRAKIDMSSVNGTMRDPVLYRYNDTPHHRTGTKHKAYPTYDFACPIIDSIEGVTHALRTTEYNDRDEQYHWIQEALGLRRVEIQAFGKMNFINTVLSKRKLTWFVEQKLVEGWFDPRFPTIQGCIRRGMNVEALKNFIIGQGASRRVITMEWDKFWSDNKKILEETCARYMGVSCDDMVEVFVENASPEITAHTVQLHPQKPEHGTRVMRRFNRILIDQIDAVTYAAGEEVTFLRWGNFHILEIVRAVPSDNSSKVVSIKARYDPDATNFSKTKKATWIANVPDLVPCKLVEFDHIISKAKLGDDEDFKDFVNPVTKKESDALCDPCLRTIAAGTVIQLERKGFYRCDIPFGGSSDKPAILFAIPDGKGKPLSTSAGPSTESSKKKKGKK